MDFEVWWLVFVPIVFALGWIAARVDARQMFSETKRLPDSYFKGLNFLLNEDHDKAIDAFVEVAKLDPETTELHFALGSLFRRRGEIERAIRVHQSLLSRADLPRLEQEHALNEIGHDFFKAGMFDRAEEAFKEVLHTDVYGLAANKALIRIYESEHDWLKAIEAVKQLQSRLNESVPQLVHYYCELTEGALRAKPIQQEATLGFLQQARQAYGADPNATLPSLVRIEMLSAQIATKTGDLLQARQHLRTIFTKVPEFSGLVAPTLLENYVQTQQEYEGLEFLMAQYKEYPSLDLFSTIFKFLRTKVDPQQAWDFAQISLRLSPSLLGLDKLLEVELNAPPTNDGRVHVISPDVDLGLLHKMISKHSQRLDRYSCGVCGFQAHSFYWQCPGCNQWETYSTKRLEEM